MSAAAYLDALWSIPPDSSGHRLFVLVDHAGCTDLMSRLARSPSMKWLNLFEGSQEAGALQVAPILIDLGEVASPPPAARHFLSALAHECQTSNAVLMLRSRWSHENLADAMRARMDAMLPDDLPVLLRYFDTRVYASLLDVFTPEQRSTFCCPASHWWWLDRAGQWCEQTSTETASDTFRAPILLDAQQQSGLIAAGLADAVAHEVRLAAPDLCEGRSRAALHAHVETCLLAARRHQINTLSMQTLYCIVALELGPAFDQQPEWSSALAAARKQNRGFDWVVRQVEKEVRTT